MTDRDVVEHVAKLFGRAVVRLRRRKPHHKLPYATTIKGSAAVRVMRAVRPFLGESRQLQIDRAIASWTPRRVMRIATAPLDRFTAHESREACDRAWLAGLLEGEGSFLGHRNFRASYPVIKVEMCEQKIVERAAGLLDTRVWLVPPGTEGWRPTYVAQIAGHRAAGWMRALRPYMGFRRTAAIDAALASYQPIWLIAPPLVCTVTGCERRHRARGLCNTHYMRWSRDREKGRVPRITPLR